ncbi:hypothetical protein [Acanthamoeba polyphaga mimivirus]|uniref:Ankyrin repeat protein n=1 Tax=Acanthamoeba polyphaga mimivirus TaxID=212035 RepID=A0A0G2Y0S9_MIMIV|nr:hypothetical protein [Acanthamoeba castellanii mamavirus]AKI79263.1 hypothetical protein [Acanthamoeba polyphaga mimivirus]EJN40922.1 hypothetical protein lvs_L418 [Acanthamoeba polyphaga lentillevirus]UMZ07987.1 hypothetical protein [Acanthamoeba polyphaga mimivirus]
MLTKNTNNFSNSSNDPLNLYLNKNYAALANSDLTKKIDSDGNTVVHKMAKNLDHDAFDSILKHNPTAFKYNVINTANKRSELPIHKAMETLQSGGDPDHGFIDYLINGLGANPNVPDASGRTITQVNPTTYNPTNPTGSTNVPGITHLPSNTVNDQSVKQLNDQVIKNIRNLAKTAEDNINKISPKLGQSLRDKGVTPDSITNAAKNVVDRMPMIDKFFGKQTANQVGTVSQVTGGDNNVEFLRQLTNHYSTLRGGRSTSDRSDMNRYDSFVAKNKNSILNNYDRQYNDTFSSTGGKANKKLGDINTEDINNLFTDDAQNENSDNSMNTWGGAKKTYGNKSRSNDNSDNNDDSDDSERDIIDRRQTTKYQNMFSSQERPRERNTKVDEIYRSFVKKIMDLLGVDEETAKLYRSAIKIDIGNKNPELRKWENDELKIQEMEKIFNNKQSLQNALDKIDMDQIKSEMSRRRDESNKRRDEKRKDREEKRRQKRSQRSDTRKQGIDSATSDEATSDQTQSTDSNNTTQTASKKRTRKSTTSQSRVGPNNYLRSEDIIISTEN